VRWDPGDRDVFVGEYFSMNGMLAAKHDVNSAACIDLKLSIDWWLIRKGRR
jgi:hypothetical protein